MAQRKTGNLRSTGEQLESRYLLTTVASTRLTDVPANEAMAEFSEFASGGDLLFFDVGNEEIWRTDGSTEGTLKLADADRPDDRTFEVLGLTLFNVRRGDENSIWRTDGTPEGTFELLPNRRFENELGTYLGNTVVLREPTMLHAFGQAFFTVQSHDGWELYRTDGTPAGTEKLSTNLSTGPVANSNGVFFVSRGHLLKIADDESQPRILMHVSRTADLQVVQDRLVLLSRGSLWVGDGDDANPVTFVAGFRSHTVPTVLDDAVVFMVPQSGIYRTDGTIDGSYFLDDTSAAACNHNEGIVHGRAYFSSTQCDTTIFWSSTDGTETFSTPSASWRRGSFEFVRDRVALLLMRRTDDHLLGHEFYLVSEEHETTRIGANLIGVETGNVGDTWYARTTPSPWAGGEPGLHRIDIATGDRSTIDSLGGTLLSNNSTRVVPGSRQSKPYEANQFVVDEDGTLSVFDGGVSPMQVMQLGGPLNHFHYDENGLFFFRRNSNENAHEVWVSDGTAEGTVPVELNPAQTSSALELILWDGKTLAIEESTESGSELYLIEADSANTPKTVYGGHYVLDPGEDLRLKATLAGFANPLQVRWDLDNDGEFDDAFGTDATVSRSELAAFDPPLVEGEFQIRVQVEDGLTGETIEDSATLRIRGTPPPADPNTRLYWTDMRITNSDNGAIDLEFFDTFTSDQPTIYTLNYRFDSSEPMSATISPETPRSSLPNQMGTYELELVATNGDRKTTNWYTLELGTDVRMSRKDISLVEGEVLKLEAEVSGLHPYVFDWDLNGDGNFDDATGERPFVKWSRLLSLDPPVSEGTFPVVVRATDLLTRETTTASATGSVSNRSPMSRVDFFEELDQVAPPEVSLRLIASDPGLDELDITFTHTVNAEEVQSIHFVTSKGDEQFMHVLTVPTTETGLHRFRLEVKDSDGFSTSASRTVDIGHGVEINLDSPEPLLLRAGNAVWLSATSIGLGDSPNIQWDLNGDGQFDDATGKNVRLTWDQLAEFNLANPRTEIEVATRAQDPTAGIVVTSTRTLKLRAAEPEVKLAINAPDLVVAGTPFDVELLATGFESDEIRSFELLAGGTNFSGLSKVFSISFEHAGAYSIRGQAQLELIGATAEHQIRVVTAGDTNADGQVDFEDFLILSANYGKDDAEIADGDFDGDGRVSFSDFVILAARFLDA